MCISVIMSYKFETLVLRPNRTENYEHTHVISQAKVIIYYLYEMGRRLEFFEYFVSLYNTTNKTF